MVFKKSEYQNQFKSSVISKNQSIYQENLTFRHERRDKEFIHTPISWYDHTNEDVLSSEEETNENFNCNVASKLKSQSDEPAYQSLAEILDQSKAKIIAFRQQKKEDNHTKDLGLPDVLTLGKLSLGDEGNANQMKKTEFCKDAVVDSETLKEKPVDRTAETESDPVVIKEVQHRKTLKSKSNIRKKSGSKKKSSEHHLQSTYNCYRPSSAIGSNELDTECHSQEANSYRIPTLSIGARPRRPDRQKRIPSAKSRAVSQDRPPFVAYGAGDREDTFTTHRTHNVRSAVDVYGSALKAKIRREEERKRQMERQRRLAQSASDILDKLASATPRDMIDYRSEYQKQFHGYEPKEYERSSSSRAVIHHSVPIRAVHRGGGLIVHVD